MAPAIILLALNGLYVLVAVVGLACNVRVRRFLSQASAAIKSALQKCSFSGRRAKEPGEADLLVEKRLQELRMEGFRWGCIVHATASLLIKIFEMSQGLAPATLDAFLANARCFTWGIAAVFPSIVSPWTVDALYGAIAAWEAVDVSPLASSGDPNGFTYSLLRSTILMLCLNMLRRCAPASVACNLLVVAGASSKILVDGYDTQLALLLALTAVCVPACAQVVDECMRTMVRRGIEMKAIQELLDAACALLRSCCEVVVELDAEGRIVTGASELGGFLLQSSTRRFQGRVLAELIAEANDRDTFMEKLGSPPPSHGLAQAMHVRMRDATSALVKVELLWFGFHHVDGQQRYMLGLREWNEQTARGVPSLPAGAPELSTSLEASGAPSAFDDAASVSDSSTEGLEAVATVDATLEGLPIQSCSTGFYSRVGRLPQGCRLAELAEGDGGAIEHWVQRQVNNAIDREGEGDRWKKCGEQLPMCRTTFKLRRGEMDATCRLLLLPGEHADITHVQVLFSRVKWKGDRSSRSRTPRETTAAPATDQRRGTPTTRASL